MAYNPSTADTSQLLIGSPLVLVPGVEGLDGPGRDRSSVDITAIDDSVSKQLSGKAKMSDCTFNLRWDPANAQHIALEAANKSGALISCEIICSDGGAATITFQATVATWKHTLHSDNPLAVACALRPYQDWVLTP